MAKKQKYKRKMTAKQAIILEISIIVAILVAWSIFLYLAEATIVTFYQKVMFVSSYLVLILVCWLILNEILRIPERKLHEKKEKRKSELMQVLSKDKCKEVLLRYPEPQINNVLEQILKEQEEFKFYAKCSNDNNITVIAIDKHGENRYYKEITDIAFFDEHFKLKE